ncbi:MAG: helix-turn-helix domain-containing protein, partial [Gemmatimonadota bacterium]|nr:helix-turn-helix domain-containing protein [Gemmatimonadota bacterium]
VSTPTSNPNNKRGFKNASKDVRVIRAVVRKLRRKLDDDADSPSYIFTELRVGYRMPKGQEPGQERG